MFKGEEVKIDVDGKEVVIRRIKKGFYLVPSTSDATVMYQIDLYEGSHNPMCPSFQYRGYCKHYNACLKDFRNIIEDKREEMKKHNGKTIAEFYKHFTDSEIDDAMILGDLKIIGGRCYII